VEARKSVCECVCVRARARACVHLHATTYTHRLLFILCVRPATQEGGKEGREGGNEGREGGKLGREGERRKYRERLANDGLKDALFKTFVTNPSSECEGACCNGQIEGY
jgi:hypothetical protein